MAHILLIDDDSKVSEMLSEYLSSKGFRITPAFTGHDGELAIQSNRFDAVILDIMLPDINGIEVLRRIRNISSIPVMMLTAQGDDVDRVIGLEMGADDYLAKPYFPRELLARLRAILRRQVKNDPANTDNLTIGELTLSIARREVSWRNSPFELTTTEFNMLAALMRSDRVVMTKENLSLIVLGRTREQYDRSVDVHVGHLRRKLAAVTDGGFDIETVRGIGYRLKAGQ